MQVVADGAGSHCNKAVNLFLIKKTPEIFVEQEEALFTHRSVLNMPQVTVRLFLESFLAPPEKEPPGIVLHGLPPYSPNLNPIERVWKVKNECAQNNQVFPSFEIVSRGYCAFFTHTWDEIKPPMDTRINDNLQLLKPAS